MRLLVQGVGARVRWQYDRAWVANEDKRGRLVVIAEHDDIVRSSVEAELMDSGLCMSFSEKLKV